jgi:transposase
MLPHDTRIAILALHQKGYSLRAIARILKISRPAVRRVLAQGTVEVPRLLREDSLTSELARIRELYVSCEGNLVRVHEELGAAGIDVGYTTLTAFCRRHGLGVEPKCPAGTYDFAPGQEMQHDTSPHHPLIAGRPRLVHCASLVLCYSRMLYAQVYPRWTRFWCKVFLTEAIAYLEGSATDCMLDNSSIVIAHGTGENAVPAPEMMALATHFGFTFRAHDLGDKDRSARVERPFHYIEHNFYPHRSFQDVPDLNGQLRAWCDKVNAGYKRSLRAAPRELFAVERPLLKRLPAYVHPPTEVHHRAVDSLGYVTVHTNSYSVPAALLDRQLDVLATKDRIRIFDGHRLVCEHERAEDGGQQRLTLDEHRDERRALRSAKTQPSAQETALTAAAPELGELARQLKRRHPGRAIRALRRLHQLYLDYPTDSVVEAVRRALDHGLYDLGRIESLVLSLLSGNFFREPNPHVHQDDVHQDDVHQDDVHQDDVHQDDVHQDDVHQDDVHQDDVHQDDVHQDDVHQDDVHQDDVHVHQEDHNDPEDSTRD